MEERYAFIAEWYDANASLTRRYQFLYFPSDNAIEMVRTVGINSFSVASEIDRLVRHQKSTNFLETIEIRSHQAGTALHLLSHKRSLATGDPTVRKKSEKINRSSANSCGLR